MKVKVEKLEGSKAKLSITVEAEEFNEEYEKAFKAILENVEVKGFRKGKVPPKLYIDRFGEGEILRNAVDSAINNSYGEAVKLKKVKVVSSPEVELDSSEIAKDKPLKYIATVDVLPEVELGEYFGLDIEKMDATVTTNEVEEYLQRELTNRSELEIIEGKPLEKGMTAVFDYCGYVDKVAFEGGKAENQSLEIGSNKFIPGFEEQMIGMLPEEEKTLKVKFPEEYHAKELAGKEAEFVVKLHEIKQRVLPECTKEFFEELAIDGVTSVDTWKKHLESILKLEKEEANENKYTDDVLQAVCNNAKLEVPSSLIEDRLEQYVERLSQQAQMYGLDAEQFLSYQGSSLEQYKELMRENAKRSVVEELVLAKIIETEKIKLTEKDYDKAYKKLAEQYNQDVEVVKKNYPKENVSYYFLNMKTIDLLKEKCLKK